ncbi:MAG: 5-methyltetrahydropteroyltriglutamate--homocysteine S-methyltransferase [Chloroflexi bacterium]|nr:5-methyltetrahydropteroyltriglutamate--homocysteine S-methyltransferase [Chloroflexota bacterium]
MSTTSSLGYPRIGKQRELKFALEKYWAGKIPAQELFTIAAKLRRQQWITQSENQIQILPSNDFSLYDQVLDTTWMVGAIPARFQQLKSQISDLDLYFAMARGWQNETEQFAAMEMTKWFDTNYHHIVPEISRNQKFFLNDLKPVNEFIEAKNAGFITRPVLIGPVSYLLLSKTADSAFSPLEALPNLLPVYCELLVRLVEAGAEWVQIDEPCLVLDLDEKTHTKFSKAYDQLHAVPGIHILLATYFDGLGENLSALVKLPVDGLHIDLIRAPKQLEEVLSVIPENMILSLGLVDGRNVWCTDLEQAIQLAKLAANKHGSDKLQIAPSCSLQFCPYDLDLEIEIDPEIYSWLAFARQKLVEVSVINAVINGKEESVTQILAKNKKIITNRAISNKVHDSQIQQRLKEVENSDYQRHGSFEQRKQIQSAVLNLPPLPATTIGSFPQTGEIRKQRALFTQGGLSLEAYEDFLKQEIADTIRVQEELGLDVLVHGESERTDMVEYFAEQLRGFTLIHHGWVQSYGSRAVRPPIIYGDISRPAPMTVKWARYAQSLTAKPVKGMLTGPITILQWSFVRDDQPREITCRQLALALRDEVQDLQTAGIKIIQVDEPALREGLPLHHAEQKAYLNWAVDCFRLVAGTARDETQIHTHMCYAEFEDIIDAIIRMDADVISIEASRSGMELLEIFRHFQYPNDVGPGVYDIHSPRIPSTLEIVDLIRKALQVIPAEQLWVNPDCGLKTRRWEEVLPSLQNLIAAARLYRRMLPA